MFTRKGRSNYVIEEKEKQDLSEFSAIFISIILQTTGRKSFIVLSV